MKILLSFLQDNVAAPHAIPAYRFWEYYIKNGIEEAGMSYTEVPDIDWAEGLLYDAGSAEMQRWQTETWERTLKFVKDNIDKIDIFISYLYPKQINTGAVNEIKKLGIPCVNFYCDNIREFTKAPNEFKVFDLVWVPEFAALSMYKRAGIKHIHLPMPMWVAPKFREKFTPAESPEVSFIGSKDVLRNNLLSEVIEKGLPVSIRGKGWIEATDSSAFAPQSPLKKITNQFTFIKHHGLKGLAVKMRQQMNKQPAAFIENSHILQPPDFDEYVDITQNSKITLGINRVPTFRRLNDNPITYSRLRDLEVPMLGGCYLTEYCEGLDHLYDLNKEIAVYRDAGELVSKANELLTNAGKRNSLRAAGQQRALSEHTIPISLSKIKTAILK